MKPSARPEARISAALAIHGLALRGGFDFADGEDRPAGPSGRPAGSVLLVGNVGAGFWRHFAEWRARQPGDIENPLDAWSRGVAETVAREAGARVAMPGDRPYAPFQQWAMRAEGLGPSPLGILIHPEYGLWHAWRAALLFDAPLGLQLVDARNHPCDACAGKPCLSACPVDAFGASRFAREACIAHVRGPEGTACRETGCLARNACPIGTEWRYPADAQAFFQRAFAGI